MEKIKSLPQKYHWFWAVVASVLMFLVLSLVTHKLAYSSFTANFNIACYLTICSIGQMFVITTGGAMDLSVPNMITLSAFLSMGMINGQNRNFFPVLLVMIALGIVVGFINAFLVIKVRIPAMIATLGVGYILSTFTQLYSRYKFSTMTLCGIMKACVTTRLLGIPLICYFVVAMVVLVAHLFRSVTYGRALMALGQNRRAAQLAGINVDLVETLAYMICSILAAISGMFLAGRTGGAFLGMGDSYLMDTVGSVVIGGTLCAGGRAEPVGTLFGAMFLCLVVTVMSAANFSVGMQYLIRGMIIVCVLVLSASQKHAE